MEAKLTVEAAWSAVTEAIASIDGGWAAAPDKYEQPAVVAARALALAAHDEACLTCTVMLKNPSPEFMACVELRRRGCDDRAQIEALR
jgi:hypothetical protein